MPIDFKKFEYFKKFRFGSTLVWNAIRKIAVSGSSPLVLINAAAKAILSLI